MQRCKQGVAACWRPAEVHLRHAPSVGQQVAGVVVVGIGSVNEQDRAAPQRPVRRIEVERVIRLRPGDRLGCNHFPGHAGGEPPGVTTWGSSVGEQQVPVPDERLLRGHVGSEPRPAARRQVAAGETGELAAAEEQEPVEPVPTPADVCGADVLAEDRVLAFDVVEVHVEGRGVAVPVGELVWAVAEHRHPLTADEEKWAVLQCAGADGVRHDRGRQVAIHDRLRRAEVPHRRAQRLTGADRVAGHAEHLVDGDHQQQREGDRKDQLDEREGREVARASDHGGGICGRHPIKSEYTARSWASPS